MKKSKSKKEKEEKDEEEEEEEEEAGLKEGVGESGLGQVLGNKVACTC